jgi:flagellar biogenesis protein FliO
MLFGYRQLNNVLNLPRSLGQLLIVILFVITLTQGVGRFG